MDPIISATVQVTLEKLITVAAKEFQLVSGFEADWRHLSKSLEMIKHVIEDADRRQVTDGAVKLWLKKLERVAFRADNVLDEINYENLRRLVKSQKKKKPNHPTHFNVSSSNFGFRWKMGHKINKINTDLNLINIEANGFGLQRRVADSATSALPLVRDTDSITCDPIVLGRDNDVVNIINLLVNPSSTEVVSVVPIVGLGGLGKTALARIIFNHDLVVKHFDKRIWLCASENFDVKRILKRMLELLKDNCHVESRQAIVEKLQEKLRDKTYLLVLDDLWNEKRQDWDDLKNALLGINQNKGNAIMVTTRNTSVASVVNQCNDPYYLGKLSNDECWSIIKTRAFGGGEAPKQFESIGKEIAIKCGGVPLAANMLGSVLQGKTKDEWILIERSVLSKLEGSEESIKQVLKVSFDRLPSSSLKKCFSYCSVFEKDSIIYREKLVQLWMAEGFFLDNEESCMETVGNWHFNVLLQNFFFQEAEKDKYGNITSCKIHDLVHDLARSISKLESFNEEYGAKNGIPAEVKYLAMESLEERRHIITRASASHVRALFLHSSISKNVLSHFNQLHSLILDSRKIEELPTSVDGLIHLRHLDVSGSAIKSLPDSICTLYNLQTLRIFVHGLKKLPEKLCDLISLRHLYYKSWLIHMPPTMRRLTCLQTLSAFIVSDREGRQIEELGHLKNLGGKLTINNLELVNDKEEAEKALLTGKPNIFKLRLIWCTSREGHNNDENVLEGLQPHPNLKSLRIDGFKGKSLPCWTRKMEIRNDLEGRSVGLYKLIELILTDCNLCEEIPMLGHLPSLKFLKLRGMKNLRCIGPWFYGADNSCITPVSEERRIFFPALRRFVLSNMPNLVEWAEAEVIPLEGTQTCGVQAFPCLEYLELDKCSQLANAPGHFPILRDLIIRYVENDALFSKICSNLTSLTGLKINYAKELSYLPDRLYYNNQNLRELEIFRCPKLRVLPDGLYSLQSIEKLVIRDCPRLRSISHPSGEIGCLTALRYLIISGCQTLRSLPREMLQSCTSLEYLEVDTCDTLSSLPIEFGEIARLSDVRILNCPKLTRMPRRIYGLSSLTELTIGESTNSTDFNSFQAALEGIQHLKSLRRLWLYGQLDWDTLPYQLELLDALNKLSLHGFGIQVLPEWFQKLESLEELWLAKCERLSYINSVRQLTKLQRLYIWRCIVLKERCVLPTGPDSEWPNISHVSRVNIDGKLISF